MIRDIKDLIYYEYLFSTEKNNPTYIKQRYCDCYPFTEIENHPEIWNHVQKEYLDIIFGFAADRGQTKLVKELLTWRGVNGEKINIHMDEDYAFRWACENGNYEIVKLIIENANIPLDIVYIGFYNAYSYEHYDVVILLLNSFDECFEQLQRAFMENRIYYFNV